MSDDIYKGIKYKDRLDPIEDVDDMEMFVPWFLACNPERFPYWFGQNDPRNEKIVQALRDFGADNGHVEEKCEYLFKTKLEFSNTTGVEYVNLC